MTALTAPQRDGSAATTWGESSRNAFISIQKSRRNVPGDTAGKQNAPKENGREWGEEEGGSNTGKETEAQL